MRKIAYVVLIPIALICLVLEVIAYPFNRMGEALDVWIDEGR